MTPEHKQWLARPADEALSKKLGIAAWILSAAVLALVVVMRGPKIPLPEGWSMGFLPPVHAALNSLVAICLVISLFAVKAGRIVLHRGFMFAALGFSVAFLLCYVAYHFTTPEVKFGDANFDGVISGPERELVAGTRPWYLLLLITHITLAGLSLPFILFTFISGWTNRFTAHRRLAKFVFPIWLYVAVTGPICYWMLRPYYN